MNKNNSKAILLGTGQSIHFHRQNLKDANKKGIPIIAYANSIVFALEELEIIPDYWFWFDPYSAKDALGILLKSDRINEIKNKLKIIILDPINKYSSAIDFEKYCGGVNSEWVSSGGWDTYKKQLDEIEIKYDCFYGRVTTIKNINLIGAKNEDNLNFIGKDLSHVDWGLRFDSDICVIGSELDKSNRNDNECKESNKQNFSENKLTMVALPVVQKLDYDEIYLVGWDGKNSRWFRYSELPYYKNTNLDKISRKRS